MAIYRKRRPKANDPTVYIQMRSNDRPFSNGKKSRNLTVHDLDPTVIEMLIENALKSKLIAAA